MTKLNSPLLGLGARGSLGKVVSFARRRKQDIVEKKPVPKDAKTSEQLAWRTMYQLCVDLWHTLSAAEKQTWESNARPRHMTGYAWYLSQCLRPNPGIYLPLAGGTMTGEILMGTNSIKGLPLPTGTGHATRKSYVDGVLALHAAIATAHQDAPAIAAGLIAGHAALPNVHHTPTATYTEGARVYHGANQAIPHNTDTVLVFDSERYDTDTIHDPITNNSRLTCKTAGKYIIIANVHWAAHATGRRTTKLYLNGTTFIGMAVDVPVLAYSFPVSLATIYELAVNDYMECVVHQDSGGALNVQTQSNWSVRFMMQRIG